MAKKPHSSNETTNITGDETEGAVSDLTSDSAPTTDSVVAVIEPNRAVSIRADQKPVRRKTIKGKNRRLTEYLKSTPTTTTEVFEYPTNYDTSSSDSPDEENIYDTTDQRNIPDYTIATPRYVTCEPLDPVSPCNFYKRKKCDPPAYSKLSKKKLYAIDKCSHQSSSSDIEERKNSLETIVNTPNTSKHPHKTNKTSSFTDESTNENNSDLKPIVKSTGGTHTNKYPEKNTKTDESTSYPKTNKLISTTEVSPTSEYNTSKAHLTSRMKQFGIVPDLLATYPSETLEVIYPDGVTVQLGNTLTPSKVKQKPTVKWDADPNSYYLLCMTDPDSPSRDEPKYREWNHWLVGNIPGDQVNDGETLSEYIGAGPSKGTGPHRYVFLLYLQYDELDFKLEPRLTNKTADRRAKFSIKRIAERHKLGYPIAGNFFVAEWDRYVPRLHKQLNYPPCLHLCQDD